MGPRNLGLLFKETVRQFPDKPAFFSKSNGSYRSITWREAQTRVDAIAASLLRQGLNPGDRLAIFSENRLEWALMDLAAQTLGIITVPIYPSLTPPEIRYILSDSGCSAAAVSGKPFLEKIVSVQKELPKLRFVIVFDPVTNGSSHEAKIPLLWLGDLEREAVQEKALSAVSASVPGEATASIIYTSGTTGEPKGVMLTHANFLENVRMTQSALQMSSEDVHLSFLPLSHVFERMAGHYLMVRIGASICYAESMDTVPQNLLETRPTFILGVPRFYEKIRDHVLEHVQKAGPLQKGIFFWAKGLGEKKRSAAPGGAGFAFSRATAGLLVYKKFRRRLGGRVRFCISGGAALGKEIAEFFCDLDVMIYEGYGLTETSPVISVNRPEKFKFGTVGVPLEGVWVNIAPDGEILTQGPCVMKGYYNKPRETDEVLKEGWFCTGDLGLIDNEGFLKITGRKKEILVTSGGKKISPRPIEEMMEKDPAILRCVLFGEGKNFITALLVPRRETLMEYAKKQGIAFAGYADLLKDLRTKEFLKRRIEALSEGLAGFERIKYFALLENDFAQSSGELTPTLKVKRDVVLAKYQNLLLPFYS